MQSPRGAAAKGWGLPPKQGGRPPFRVCPTLGAWASRGWFPLAHVGQGAPLEPMWPPRGRWPHPVDPRDPSSGPGTIPITPKLVPMAKTALSIYNSLPPDHSETPRDVRDLIRDSEQHSGYCIYISSQP